MWCVYSCIRPWKPLSVGRLFIVIFSLRICSVLREAVCSEKEIDYVSKVSSHPLCLLLIVDII